MDTSHITKLNGKNYSTWKLQMTLVLKASELWTVVDGTLARPAVNPDDWDKNDVEAQVIIVPLLEGKQVCHIYNCTTSNQMWSRLAQINSDASVLNKQHTLTKFYNYKISEGQSVVEGYAEIEELSRSLAEIGINMDESAVVTKIVSAMPDKHTAFKKAWDSVPDAEQTLSRLLSRLRKEELEQGQVKEETHEDQQPSAFFTKGGKRFRKPCPSDKTPQRGSYPKGVKKKGNCHNCGKPGHWARECKRGTTSNEDERTDYFEDRRSNSDYKRGRPRREHDTSVNECKAMMGRLSTNVEKTTQDAWISDSGATNHFSGQKDWFQNFRAYESPRTVNLTNNTTVQALGQGDVPMEALIKDQWIPIVIRDVVYIPGAVNLFSESVMDLKGFTIIRKQKRTVFFFGKQEGPQAEWSDREGGYVMNFRRRREMARSTRLNATTWHERLAHMNLKYIKESVKQNAVEGIKLEDLQGETHCDFCHIGKETRQPFPTSSRGKEYQPGELIHADLSGKMPVPSLYGANYFLLMKDDYSGFKLAEFLKTKDEAPGKIIEFINLIKNQAGRKVKIFKTDQGTEFVNKELDTFLKGEGILHETSAPYCPESNGRIEREMRTVKDAARTMMHQVDAPQYLWAEAVGFAVHVQNRIVNRQSGERTPFEVIFGRKPNLSHIRKFGCRAYVQVPKEKRTAWEPKATRGILVGFEGLARKFRVYDPEDRKIITVRNVSFHEDEGIEKQTKYASSDSDSDCKPARESSPTPSEDSTGSSGGSTSTVTVTPGSSPSTSSTTSSSRPYKKPSPTLVIENGKTQTRVSIQEDQSEIEVEPRKLRDRETLKKPIRFAANRAEVLQEPANFKRAVESAQAPQWREAMQKEMNSLNENQTWELVPIPRGRKILEPKWIFKIKQDSEGNENYKARLVIRGFKQDYGVDYFDTFATVCRYESIRFVLALAAAKDWHLMQFDVKTAFLNANLEEEIYMKQPEGFGNGNPEECCKLLRSLYGLKQAPRCWYQRCADFLANIGLYPSHSDPCVFIGTVLDTLVILPLYVDDGLVASERIEAVKYVLKEIKNEFAIQVNVPETYVGIQITKTQEGLFLSQSQYTEGIRQKFCMEESSSVSVPMQPSTDLTVSAESEENFPYRELIGSLLFLARVTRPDIAFAVGKLSQFLHCYDRKHWEAAKTVVKYLKGTVEMGLQYKHSENFKLRIFTDSDYAGDHLDRKSTSGHTAYINDSLISWGSQKQAVVALSSTEAEYVALAGGAKEAVWLRQFCTEVDQAQDSPTPIMVDNTSAIRLVENPEYHKRTKHIGVRFHFTRELVMDQQVAVEYINTNLQKADILTKPLARGKFEEMRGKIGMTQKPKTLPLMWTILTCMMTIMGPVNGFLKAAPVLWRPVDTPVIAGYEDMHLRIELTSPCSIITENIIHKDQRKTAIELCEEMYRSYFLEEMERMCPKFEQHSLQKTRRKRFILLATMICVALVVVGTGVGVVTSSVNAARISSQNDIIYQQGQRLNVLKQQVNISELAIRKLQEDFNTLVEQVERVDLDLAELKTKGPQTHFGLAYITSRLVMGKKIIQDATREWRKKRITDSLFDFFNLTLPCSKEDICPLYLSTGKSCYFGPDQTDLYWEISLPIINTDLQVVEADPFNLLYQSTEKMCKVGYKGPKNIIMSKSKGCPIAMDIKVDYLYDLILSPHQTCMSVNVNNSLNSYFDIDYCHTRESNDADKYIQAKAHHGHLYIYCYGNTINIDSVFHDCPDEVFILPIGVQFKINDKDYVGSIVSWEHQERPDPLFTMKANNLLQPKVDYKALIQDPLVEIPQDNDEVRIPYHVHWTWILLLVGLIAIMCIIIIWCYVYHRKFKITIDRVPSIEYHKASDKETIEEETVEVVEGE